MKPLIEIVKICFAIVWRATRDNWCGAKIHHWLLATGLLPLRNSGLDTVCNNINRFRHRALETEMVRQGYNGFQCCECVLEILNEIYHVVILNGTPTGYIAVGCHMHGISSRVCLLQLDDSMWLRPFWMKRMPAERLNDINDLAGWSYDWKLLCCNEI